MTCPSCRTGRLECRNTRDTPTPGRTLRYRYCSSCGAAYPTLETVLAIRRITPPAPLSNTGNINTLSK